MHLLVVFAFLKHKSQPEPKNGFSFVFKKKLKVMKSQLGETKVILILAANLFVSSPRLAEGKTPEMSIVGGIAKWAARELKENALETPLGVNMCFFRIPNKLQNTKKHVPKRVQTRIQQPRQKWNKFTK